MASEIHITKEAAAQRQIDAAIRMLFSGEDMLAVHTVAAAAYGILTNLDDKRTEPTLNKLYAEVLADVGKRLDLPRRQVTKEIAALNVINFKTLIEQYRRKPSNFLKHANRDSDKLLDVSTLNTESLILAACGLYREVGLKTTAEMNVFGRWHLGAYPHEQGDEIETDIGQLHELPHEVQLQVGAILLDQSAKESMGGGSDKHLSKLQSCLGRKLRAYQPQIGDNGCLM
jgi:uncharacterized protein YlaN (UPF0358 family)